MELICGLKCKGFLSSKISKQERRQKMGYTQLVTPNLNVTRTPGWCLAFVDDALGATQRLATAQASYEREIANGNVTTGFNYPSGIWVVGFAHISQGEYAEMGHVWLVAPDGHIEDANGTHVSYGAMASYLGKVAPLENPGWSSWIDGVHVFENTDQPDNQANDVQYLRQFGKVQMNQKHWSIDEVGEFGGRQQVISHELAGAAPYSFEANGVLDPTAEELEQGWFTFGLDTMDIKDYDEASNGILIDQIGHNDANDFVWVDATAARNA
jgi:hypothetical protein